MTSDLLIKIISKIVQNQSFEREIDTLYEEIERIYIDFSNVYFLSAKQSLRSNTKEETRAAIHHFIDSYNTLNTLTTKKRKKIFFFGWCTKEYNIIDKSNPSPLNGILTLISAIISILYFKINEYNNYIDWRKCSIENKKNELSFMTISIEDLERINPLFIEITQYEEDDFCGDYGDGGVHKCGTITHEYKSISTVGQLYIEEKKRKTIERIHKKHHANIVLLQSSIGASLISQLLNQIKINGKQVFFGK